MALKGRGPGDLMLCRVLGSLTASHKLADRVRCLAKSPGLGLQGQALSEQIARDVSEKVQVYGPRASRKQADRARRLTKSVGFGLHGDWLSDLVSTFCRYGFHSSCSRA